MSETIERISADVKSAMKARDKDRLSCLRGIISEMKNAGIEKKANSTEEVDSPVDLLTEEDAQKILQKVHKRRKEAAQMFLDGDRQDLADADLAEAAIIEEYLPERLSGDDLKALLAEVIQECGASSMADMGSVMKAAQPKVAGRADGREVSEAVRELLG